MRTSNIAKLIGLMLIGCSAEHTIADESDSSQAMQVIARPVCVEMCDYALSCGQISESDLGTCLNQCETGCARLEVLIPTRMYNTNGIQYTGNAADVIASVSTCYLASACATSRQRMCSPSDLGSYADTLEGKANPSLNGTMGMSNCGMREDALSCESLIAQNRDQTEAWSLTCKRTDVTATEWTCHCTEYGVEVSTVTANSSELGPAFLEACWSKERLACFYGGASGC